VALSREAGKDRLWRSDLPRPTGAAPARLDTSRRLSFQLHEQRDTDLGRDCGSVGHGG